MTRQLFLPAIEVISKRKKAIDNIECWRNTAIGSIGFLIGDKELIKTAMEYPFGFKTQIKEGFNSDGFSKDMSPTYHFYALYPLVLLAQSAMNNEYPINVEDLRKMFAFPVQLATGNLKLPAFNDSKPVDLVNEAFMYEWAYSTFEDQSFLEVLFSPKRNFLNFDVGYQFKAWNLFYGVNNFFKPVKKVVQSKNFDSSGVVLLEKGTAGSLLSCYVKYTNQMKNLRHFHNAQLDMAIIKGEGHVVIMPGNVNYASLASDGWYRSSLAHNTLVFNGKNQRRATGKLIGVGNENGIDYAITQSTNLYIHSVRFLRTVAMLDENNVLVVDQFKSNRGEPGKFELCYHQGGVWEEMAGFDATILPDSIGYRYINRPKVKKHIGDFRLVTKLISGRTVVTSGASNVNIDLVTGNGQPFLNRPVPVALFQANADSNKVINIAYLISTNGQKYSVHFEGSTESKPESFVSIVTLIKDNGKKLTFFINPDKEFTSNNLITNNQLLKIEIK